MLRVPRPCIWGILVHRCQISAERPVYDTDDEDEDDDDEENTNPITGQDPECIDLTKGGDNVPINPPTIPDPAEEELKKKLAIKVKQERIKQNQAANEGAGQVAQPATSEEIFFGCESFQKI